MNREEFVSLLEEVLKERKNKNSIYEIPYDQIYNNCLTGFDLSSSNAVQTQDCLFISDGGEPEASELLEIKLKALIKYYGKKTIIETLRKL